MDGHTKTNTLNCNADIQTFNILLTLQNLNVLLPIPTFTTTDITVATRTRRSSTIYRVASVTVVYSRGTVCAVMERPYNVPVELVLKQVSYLQFYNLDKSNILIFFD